MFSAGSAPWCYALQHKCDQQFILDIEYRQNGIGDSLVSFSTYCQWYFFCGLRLNVRNFWETREDFIFKGLADFCKFDNFSRFFSNNSTEICSSYLPKNGKDGFRWDLNLSTGWFKKRTFYLSSSHLEPRLMKFGTYDRIDPRNWNLKSKNAIFEIGG